MSYCEDCEFKNNRNKCNTCKHSPYLCDNYEKAMVVLSTEEYEDVIKLPGHMRNNTFYAKIREAFSDGTKNGQIKERLGIQPLLDAVEDLYIKADHDSVSTLTKHIFDEFDILTKQ